MTGYSVEIKETSKELTARERLMLKDTTNAVKMDSVEDELIITPVAYAILAIHNEKSDNKDYNNYIIQDKDGTTYVTGSDSFWSSFTGIYEEMKDEKEPWSIKVYKKPSKNYTGKSFITCSIV